MTQFAKFLLAACISSILFILGLILLVYVTLQTPYVKEHLAEMISQIASNEQQTIHIEDIEGHVPWDFSIPSITIADAQGVWLSVTALHIDWHPLDMLRYTLHIDQLNAEDITILRAPEATDTPAKDPSSPPTSLPNLPAIDINRISVAHLSLPAEFMGGHAQDWLFEIVGTGRNMLQGTLKTKHSDSHTALDFTADLNDAIALDLTVHDDMNGVINRIAQYPPQPLHITLKVQTDTDLTTTGEAQATLGPTQALDATFTIGSNIHLDATGTLPEFVRPDVAIDSHDWSVALHTTHDDDIWRFSDTVATYGNATMHAEGGINLEDETFLSPYIMLNIPQLAPWANNIQGNARISLALEGTFDDTSAHVNLSSDSVKTGDTHLLAPNAKYTINTSLNAWKEQGWAVSDFTLNASTSLNEQNFALNAKGKTQNERIITLNTLRATTPYTAITGNARYDLNEKDVAAQIKTDAMELGNVTNGQMKGVVNANIRANGTLDRLPIDVSVTAHKLQGLPDAISHLSTDKATLNANAIISPTLITLDKIMLQSGSLHALLKGKIPLKPKNSPVPLTLDITHPNYADIRSSVTMQQQQNRLNISDIVLNTQDTTVKGALTIIQNSGFLDGEVHLNSANIASLAAWANLPDAEGTLRADVTFDAAAQQAFNTALKAQHIIIPKQQLAIGNIALNASSPNLSQMDMMHVSLQSDDIRNNDMVLQRVNASLNPGQQASSYNIALNGAQAGKPFTLSSAGLIASQKAKTDITVSKLEGNYDVMPFALQQPTALSLHDNTIALDPTLLSIDSGTLRLLAHKDASQVDASVTLSELPLGPLLGSAGGALPPAIANGTIIINGVSARPVIQSDLHIVADIPEAANNAKIDISSQWNNNMSSPIIKNVLSVSMAQEIIHGDVSVPASLSLHPFALNIKDNAALKGALNADMDLKEFEGWTKPLGHEIAGLLKANMILKGTVSEPDFNGTLDISDMTYDHLRYGVCVRSGEVSASFKKDEMLVARIAAQGHRNKGTLEGKGNINFTNGDIDTSLDMTQLAIFCQGMAEGEIAGTMGVTGKLNNMLAKGDIAIGPLNIYIPTGGAETIKTVDYAYQSELKRQEEEGLISLDINVAIPETVYVRGRGLNAELGGGVHVTGTASTPKIEGRFTTERGTLEFLGSNLSINDGYVRFINKNPAKPYIYLESETSADGVDIDFTIKGPATDPKFTFGSSPALPKDEILALMLFGSRLNDVTPFQALQLASAAASLSGKGGGGAGLLGSTRDRLGLDSLNVDVDETGTATVGAGKYITDKVFVGVEQGTQPGSRRFTTEIEVTPNITAETSTTQQGEPTVGLEWQYDY